jgi:transcriptional regulator with XRE-family HTH domain
MPEKGGFRTHIIKLKHEKALREGRDISYQEIADLSGLSYMTVHRYATKSIPRPDFETVLRLAEYFGVPMEEVVYQESEEGQPAGVV